MLLQKPSSLRSVRPYLRAINASGSLQLRSLSSVDRTPAYTPPKIEPFEIKNEPFLSYMPGSPERTELRSKLNKYRQSVANIPIVIGGQRYTSPKTAKQVCPFEHGHTLAEYHLATPELSAKAIDASIAAAREWENVDIAYRIKTLLKAADLVSGKYRQDLNATTMLGQGKTIIQAEIDAVGEMADFFRFNAYYVQDAFKWQPISPSADIKNTYRMRGLEGFVASISPFNFTAIAGNLSTVPALLGNAVVWKPSGTAVLSNYLVYQILEEAGFAPGVISFLPSNPQDFSNHVISSPDLAAVNFTGSVPTFRTIWKNVANNLDNNKNFPRMVGECGGKDFHFIHPSADLKTAVAQTVRAAFEYSGQKCSACSRAYIPKSLWPKFEPELLDVVGKLKLGSPLEFDSFLSAVIDGNSFDRLKSAIEFAKSDSATHKILIGGKTDRSTGYYISPTVVLTNDPKSRLMTQELFGPVLTVYVYDDNKIDETLRLVDQSTPFALTGSIFATDQQFLKDATEKLKYSAGNFYINDKSTGAVVGQQPFGGGRLSGTNDKAGAPHYLLRWLSPQNIKQTFVPMTEWSYPYMKSAE